MSRLLGWPAGIDYSFRRAALAEELATFARHGLIPTASLARRSGAVAAGDPDERIAASWGRPGGDVVYAIVADEDVDPAVFRASMAGREFACAHLGVPTPPMRFYRPEDARDSAYRVRYGVADWPSFMAPAQNGHADRTTNTIGVRADIAPAVAAEVAAHEVLHLTQPGRDREAEERSAQAYGQWAAEVVVPDRTAVAVHRFDGFPYNFRTLAGIAAPGDVVVANDDGEIRICRNSGSKANPHWVPHWASCPVPTSSAGGR